MYSYIYARDDARTCKVKTMRKKISLFFIVVLLLVLSLSMFACNKNAQNGGDLPEEINPSDIINNDDDDDGNMTASLKFSFPEGAPSVFNSLFTDEFDISKVEYCVVYTNTESKATTEGKRGNLSVGMIKKITDSTKKDENGILINFVEEFCTTDGSGNVTAVNWQKGHYTVWVEAEGIEGSFALHLQDKLNPTPSVTFNIDAKDGNRKANILFKTVSVDNDGIATVRLDQGLTFETWDNFADEFRMSIEKDSAGEAKALDGVKINGKTYNATSGFPLVIDASWQGKTMETLWTDDTVTVTFNLAIPSGAEIADGKINPSDNDALKAALTQTVRRNTGKAVAPQTDLVNVLTGYHFAGWYLDADTTDGEFNAEKDTVWNFAKQVGSKSITLIARWAKGVYSFTLYTMGGEFKSDVSNAIVNNVEIKSDEDAAANGLTVVKAQSSFGIESKKITKIEFSGLQFGTDYSSYIANVTLSVDKNGNPDKSAYLKITGIENLLFKGNGEYVKVDGKGVYGEYQCENVVNMETVNGLNTTGYVKWVFNDSDDATIRLQRLSNYYGEVVFKNGISVNADGTLRIDKIADESLSELVIPKELIYDGATRSVTEISSKACMNLKALTKLDLSQATELKKIGEYAFAHAPYLKTVILPKDGGKIESVGQKMFYGSAFENNYFASSKGKQFIVIGNILYKYVGSNDKDVSTVDTLNLGTNAYYTEENTPALTAEQRAEYNKQLAAVTLIADGAFADATGLESITLGDAVERIENGAFANLAKLDQVSVGSNSKLSYIGENAFDGTSMLTSKGKNYRTDAKAIIVGKVYYRFIDKSASTDSATLPADIEHIAPYAFDGCNNITSINLAKAKNLKSVGKRAFTSTKWIRDNTANEDGFVIIAGNDGKKNTKMLVDFYSTGGKESENITIPSDVTSIGEETFYLYANNVKTVTFGTNIDKIDNYAFKGATSLESFIFTNVAFDGENYKLVGAPQIAQNAFANANGELTHNATFYFRAEVLKAFDDIIAGTKTTQDAATLQWAELYRLNKDNFQEEVVSAVYINTEEVSTVLQKTDKNKNAFETTYTKPIPNGLIVRNNTGIAITEDLDVSKAQVIVVTKDGDYAALYEEGVTKYVVTFKYHNKTEGCHINVGDEHLYVATVYNAIAGVPPFNEEGKAIAIGIKAQGNFYLDGFVPQGEEGGAPLFYTSYVGGETKFVYTDIEGTKHTLPITKIENFDTSTASNGTRKATVTVDFHGIGVYKFSFEYVVKVSQISDMVQDGAISVPLNGNAADALADFKVRLIGQDGSVSVRSINSGVGFTYGSIDTSVLGFHQLTVNYASDNVEGYMKTITLAYSVVLEADASLFEYSVVNQKEIEVGGVQYAGQASVTRCSATNAETIVLPTTWTHDGNVYIVTDIANNTFEGFTKLKAIYLGANIKNIGSRAFAKCTALENVYTVEKVNAKYADIKAENMSVVETSKNGIETVYNATITKLDGITPEGNVIAIGSQYVVETKDGETVTARKIYNIVGVNVNDGKDYSSIEIFLPDTLTSTPSVTNGSLNVYSTKSGIMFKVVKYANDKLEHIGTGAFEGCSNLKQIDLSKATELNYIGANAFAKSGLTSIDLSANTKLNEINMSTFAECANLATVKLPASIDTIADHAFYNCYALTSIDGVSEVARLANNAYEGCKKLTEANRPSQKSA